MGLNTGVGCHALLYEIFLIQGSNPHVPLCAVLCLVAESSLTLRDPMDYTAHKAPLSMEVLQARILEWAAMPFSRGFSQPRD